MSTYILTLGARTIARLRMWRGQGVPHGTPWAQDEDNTSSAPLVPDSTAGDATTATHHNARLIRRLVEDGLNQRNLACIDDAFAAHFVFHGFGHRAGVVSTPMAAKHDTGQRRAVFPDLQYTIEDQIAAEDMVVTRWTRRGTHHRPLETFVGTIPPTGKTVTVTGIYISRVRDGKIVEHWEEVDLLSLLQQVGALSTGAPDQADEQTGRASGDVMSARDEVRREMR